MSLEQNLSSVKESDIKVLLLCLSDYGWSEVLAWRSNYILDILDLEELGHCPKSSYLPMSSQSEGVPSSQSQGVFNLKLVLRA